MRNWYPHSPEKLRQRKFLWLADHRIGSGKVPSGVASLISAPLHQREESLPSQQDGHWCWLTARARARASTLCCDHSSGGRVLQIPVSVQRLPHSDKTFRAQYSKPTQLTDPKVSSGMNQYQFRLYLNILFKYSLSLLMLGWEVQSFKYFFLTLKFSSI